MSDNSSLNPFHDVFGGLEGLTLPNDLRAIRNFNGRSVLCRWLGQKFIDLGNNHIQEISDLIKLFLLGGETAISAENSQLVNLKLLSLTVILQSSPILIEEDREKKLGEIVSNIIGREYILPKFDIFEDSV